MRDYVEREDGRGELMTYWYMVAYFASGCLGNRILATDYNALTPVGIHRLIEEIRQNGEEVIILNVVPLNCGVRE